jgi:hypothetical protein
MLRGCVADVDVQLSDESGGWVGRGEVGHECGRGEGGRGDVRVGHAVLERGGLALWVREGDALLKRGGCALGLREGDTLLKGGRLALRGRVGEILDGIDVALAGRGRDILWDIAVRWESIFSEGLTVEAGA